MFARSVSGALVAGNVKQLCFALTCVACRRVRTGQSAVLLARIVVRFLELTSSSSSSSRRVAESEQDDVSLRTDDLVGMHYSVFSFVRTTRLLSLADNTLRWTLKFVAPSDEAHFYAFLLSWLSDFTELFDIVLR